MILLPACDSGPLPRPSNTHLSITTQEFLALKLNENPQITSTSLSTLTPRPLSTTPTSTTPTPSNPYTPTIRTPTPKKPTLTPTLTECMKAGGRIDVNEFNTTLLPDPLVYRIYLPPCYDEQLDRSYPVLYLIHGQSSSDTQWDRIGAPEIADRLIASGEAAPFIIVMPRDRIWKEPTEDNFGLAVEQSLIPWVDEHYRTMPDRVHRAIGGLSRGGAWAIHLGLSHPELFSAMGAHSGFVFHSDVQQVHEWLNQIIIGMAPRIFMDVANEDRPEIAKSAAFLEELLTQFNIPHEWYMYVGYHVEAYWQSHVEDYLRWYIKEWK